MTDTLARLLAAVQAADDDVDPLMLADAAWLAAARSSEYAPHRAADSVRPVPRDHQADRPHVDGPADTDSPTSPAGPASAPVFSRRLDGGTPVRGVPLSLGRSAALPEALELGRALRAFRRPWPHGLRTQLDIDATVDHYTRSGTLLPVFTAASERWFEAVLVVDTSLTMTVWKDLARALSRVLRDLGAFRAVHVWQLSWTDDGPRLHDHQGHEVRTHRAPQHSGSPLGRRLLLVLTDCAAPGWRQQAPWQMLRGWGRSAPLALLNPLPRRLWHRSALDHPPCRAVAPRPAAPARALRPTGRRPQAAQQTGQVLPVLTPAPHALRAWANTVMRSDPNGCEAVLVPPSGCPSRNRPDGDALDPSALADAFVRTAPPAAVRLAVLAAATGSFTVPMLQVLRERAVPGTGLADMAEVLSSGLLTVLRQTAGDPLLAFALGARQRLHQELTRRDVRLVHHAMSAHLADHPYAPHGIRSVLHTADASHELPADLTPFAQAGADALKMLGFRTATGPSASTAGTAAEDTATTEVRSSASLEATGPEAVGRFVPGVGGTTAPLPEDERARDLTVGAGSGGLLRRLWRSMSGRGSERPGAERPQAVGSGAAVIGQTSVAVGGSITGPVLTAGRPSAREMRPVSMPHLLGTVPPRAQAFQQRAETARLRASMGDTGTVTPAVVLTGMGGVGKTQIAADYARTAWDDGSLDVLVWITASTRAEVVAGLARAGVELCGAEPDDAEYAARVFLNWLTTGAGRTPYRWLVVLDDITDPHDLGGLWPPSGRHGRTLVTTRRRDAVLTAEGRLLIHVGLFTDAEAAAYLTTFLGAHDRQEPTAQLTALAVALGHLPVALSQAAAHLVDSAEDVTAYRLRLTDRTALLSDTAPDRLPDTYALPLAAVWSLSIDHADALRPTGLASPMLQLAALLDGNGIPQDVLTSMPVRAHLAALGPASPSVNSGRPPVSPREAQGALRALYRVGLIDHTPDTPHHAVRIHQLVQRATRDALTPAEQEQLARTAADGLLAVWPEVERDTALTGALRANAEALTRRTGDALYRPDAHGVLFHTGRSLGESGQAAAAHQYFRHLAATTSRVLGPDHPDTQAAWGNLARWRGETGDAAGAVTVLTDLLGDRLRTLGPDHPTTLTTRHNLAHWRGETGDAAGAAAAFTEILADAERVLGPDHPDTLATRNNLARRLGEAGDATGATAALGGLIEDRTRALGPDHPDTLATRHSLAHWRGEAGDATGAVAALGGLIEDRTRVLGPDHPDTLATRHSLAHWRGRTGDAAGAAQALEELLTDMTRVFGPDHPRVTAARDEVSRWREVTAGPGTKETDSGYSRSGRPGSGGRATSGADNSGHGREQEPALAEETGRQRVFRLDQDAVTDLLMGAQLYGDRGVAVRELYQNALDACRHRRARYEYISRVHGVAPLPAYEPQIAFTQGVDEAGRPFLECADNGVGMDEEEARHMFTAGGRAERSPRLQNELADWRNCDPPVVLRSNSRFGIGVFSYFMLADRIEVRTCRMDRQGRAGSLLRITVDAGSRVYRTIPVEDFGTPGTRVRLLLREPPDATGRRPGSLSVALERVLGIAEVRTSFHDGVSTSEWLPGVLRPSGRLPGPGPRVRVGGWTVPCLEGRVIWCEEGGALLVDGLLIEAGPAARHLANEGHGTLPGAVVNLPVTTPGLQLSVNRTTLQNDVSSVVEEMLTQAADELVAERRGRVTETWIADIERRSPMVATVLREALNRATGTAPDHG